MRISDWSSDVCSSDLGAGIGLLEIVGDRDRVELTHRSVAGEHAARIFPGDRAAGFDLGPAHLAVGPRAQRALGDEIVDAALAVLVARIPVLDGRIFDLGIVERDQPYPGGFALVLD